MMNGPDHSNYEAWLLDRLEGRLTPEQERALDAFLLLHPDLAPLDDGPLPTLDDPLPGLPPTVKDDLKRELPPTGMPRAPIDDFLIAREEGDLDPAQLAALEAWLAAHPEDVRAAHLYALARVPHAEVRFPTTEDLKRELPPTGMPSAPIDDLLIAREEGDLTPAQLAALDVWLAAHPEDARAARLYALARVPATAERYPAPLDLKRDLPPTGMPTPGDLDDHLVARMEGDLSPEQAHALDQLLARDPQARRQWALMQRTRVAAEPVTYPDKAGLKKKEVRVIPLFTGQRGFAALRLAASVAILLAFGAWWVLRAPQQGSDHLAQVPGASTEPPSTTTAMPGTPTDGVPASDGATTTGDSAIRTAPTEHRHPEVAPQGHMGGPGNGSMDHSDPAWVEERTAPTLEPVNAQLAYEPIAPDSPAGGLTPEVEATGDQAVDALPETLLADNGSGTGLGELIAREVRERMLDNAAGTGKLGEEDALAAVDKGLRTISAGRAGLEVERDPRSGRRNYELRLGRNLAITASR